jgi:hypothetical protein
MVIVYMLFHALPVFFTGVFSQNKTALIVSAIIMGIIGAATGNPVYFIADLFAITLAYLAANKFMKPASPNADIKPDAGLLEIRKELLKTSNPHAHEQMSILMVGAQIHQEVNMIFLSGRLSQMSQDEKERWFSDRIERALKLNGYTPSFLRVKLSRYVYDLYMKLYLRLEGAGPLRGSSMSEIRHFILSSGAEFLDGQDGKGEIPDICSFLKDE